LNLLGQEEDKRSFASLGAAGRLVPGTVLPEPQGVFPRYVEPESEGGAGETPKPKEKAPKSKQKPKA
ncbi:MAG TPA: hypothetical protein VGA65_00950, partial [Hyphomicrobium sp.]